MTDREAAYSLILSRWALVAVVGVALLIVGSAVVNSCWLQDEFPFRVAFPYCGAEISGYGGGR